MPNVIRQLKTENRCKICSSPHRKEIEDLILRRSDRIKADDGSKVNLDYLLAAMAQYGIENPTAENVKGHWKNHIEKVPAEEVAADIEVIEAAVQEMESGNFSFEDLDEGLRFFFTVGIRNLRRKIAAGEDPGITHDHLLKTAGEITKRRTNDAQAELMKALGGGIERVFTKALGGDDEPKQIEGAEVIDVEPVTVDE